MYKRLFYRTHRDTNHGVRFLTLEDEPIFIQSSSPIPNGFIHLPIPSHFVA
jgi:hypothetical protein